MTTVSIQEAQANLAQLIHQLPPGDELVITENNQPVARLVASGAPPTRNDAGNRASHGGGL
ncbi:MAG: type II toxin-antitoxin system prevent-host-death family antitoxin [Planctomycetes bacterium]|nr:type II toxin-antitoxin system prevent-host-death family antitoxin [Planctomycetota bacterium]